MRTERKNALQNEDTETATLLGVLVFVQFC